MTSVESTASGAITEAPLNLTIFEEPAVDGAGPAVLVQWEPAPCCRSDSVVDEGGEIPDTPTVEIAGYKLYYDEEGTDAFTEFELGPTTCTCRIHDLKSDAVYRFQLLAYNDLGEGPETPILRWSATSQGGITIHGLLPDAGSEDAEPESEYLDCEAAAKLAPNPTPLIQVADDDGDNTSAQNDGTPSSEPMADESEDTLAPLPGGMGQQAPVRMRGRSTKLTKQLRGNRVSWVVPSRAYTIRGKKNGVRAAKKQLAAESRDHNKVITPLQRTIDQEKNLNKLVLYVTSVSTIRETFRKCQKAKQLLYNLRVKAYILDISLDKQLAKDLAERAEGQTVPQLFARGVSIGGYEELFEANECGELKEMLSGFTQSSMTDCVICGGTGFTLCSWCDGSKKSSYKIGREFETDHRKTALRCTVCNENGLERCRAC